jgi:hypothetical protein
MMKNAAKEFAAPVTLALMIAIVCGTEFVLTVAVNMMAVAKQPPAPMTEIAAILIRAYKAAAAFAMLANRTTNACKAKPAPTVVAYRAHHAALTKANASMTATATLATSAI